MNPTRPLVTAAACAVALTALAALTGCGEDGDGSTDAARDTQARSSLSLTMQGARSTRAFVLRCDPDGGTWPDAVTACDGLRAAPDVLEPITIETRDLVPITTVPLTVTGEFDGKAVSLTFPARGSSTRRGRYVALREALGADAFDEAAKSVQ